MVHAIARSLHGRSIALVATLERSHRRLLLYWTILASLVEGSSIEEILEDFPSLSEEGIRAVIAFAAASAVEDLPLRGVPALR